MEATERARTSTPVNVSGRTSDETKLSLKTTKFWHQVHRRRRLAKPEQPL